MLTMFSWFTLPTASDMIASSTVYSADVFTSLTFLIGVAVGIPIAVGAVIWLIRLLKGNVGRVFRGKKGGRRRKR